MLYEEMGVRPSSVDSQHPASCRMCPYIGILAGFLYTRKLQFFFQLHLRGKRGRRQRVLRVF
jgi:hypothetical protein